MAKDDQQEAFEKLLASTLTRTIDFVKFAETKNAALLTFSSAWILASTNLVFGVSPLPPSLWRTALIIAIPLFVIAAVLSIVSFLPRLKLASFHKDPEQKKALLYFGDAATFSPSSYRERLFERYMPPGDQTATKAYLDDLCVQISVNSTIAVRKFLFFKSGACFALAAVGVLIIPAIRYAYGLAVTP